ncbi:unnamed protein product [Oikopleura dioica]|uniref:Uncharacterized protein n=1 Tax=Oikopleura dioica TaxID=34765 RepID=E4WYS6_OIKDI|nr:unnamed protein product [Oikopleura dioica]
MLKIQLVKKIL